MGILHAVYGRAVRGAALLSALWAATGCAVIPDPHAPDHSVAYVPPAEDTLLARYAPVVVSDHPELSYNRIGRPSARRGADGEERIYVDPAGPVVYARQRDIETEKARYTNLAYRVHFEQVPFSLFPFHLTTGRNGGLLFVLTLNQRGEPLLLTTVHTCGCYLAFLPTSYLPESAYPEGWDPERQQVFGQTLPGRLAYPARFDPALRPVIHVRHATHRIKDVQVAAPAALATRHRLVTMEMAPMEKLTRLPLDGATTSFYDREGFRKGYVKGSFKPLELLLMSWWTFDLHVGVDKAYGDAEETGTLFYTSLRPWRREESDMWEFAGFLEFWGWKL